jgi:hypothetical protein
MSFCQLHYIFETFPSKSKNILFGQIEFLFGSPFMDFVVETYNQVFTALLQNWVRLAERVANVMKGYPTLSLTHGRKVLESCASQCCWVQLQCLQVLIWSAVGLKYTLEGC